MPHVTWFGFVVMGICSLLAFSIYSIIMLIPCWIIAKRRGVAGRWWNWIIPVRNLYFAYKLGDGPMKQGGIILALTAFGAVAAVYHSAPKVVIVLGAFALLVALVLSLYVLFIWFKNIGVLAGVHPFLLPLLLLALPLVASIVIVVLTIQQVVSAGSASVFQYVISVVSWLIFVVVALQTPREPLQPDSAADFQLSKE